MTPLLVVPPTLTPFCVIKWLWFTCHICTLSWLICYKWFILKNKYIVSRIWYSFTDSNCSLTVSNFDSDSTALVFSDSNAHDYSYTHPALMLLVQKPDDLPFFALHTYSHSKLMYRHFRHTWSLSHYVRKRSKGINSTDL